MANSYVLCIDDDAPSLKVREMLLQVAGYETLSAADGPSGLLLFEFREIKAVVVDYTMPGMNGAEVARKMHELKPNVPIIMLSGQSSRPWDVGPEVDSFLVKGSSGLDLLSKLSELLD